MNLVQINERLKDLPMQVIQQYANGMNPEVPPYLALGELQRRETAQKQMATAQGAAQGPQPSVKEQMEQKAGLMAAQGLQQQQAMQQMAQRPQGALPIPAGMPQPEPQPEVMTAASGGLARAPVRFDFQHGGIVAFEEGGKTSKYETPYDRMNRKNRGELTEEEQKKRDMIEALLAQIPKDKNIVEGGERVEGSELERNVRNTAMALPGASAARALSGSLGAGRGVAAGLAAMPDRSEQAPQVARPAAQAAPSRSVSEAQATAKAGPQAAVPPAPIADLKALAEQKRKQQGPRPAPAVVSAPAAPAQPAPESMDAMLRAQMAAQPKQRTLEEQLAEQRAARQGAGMTEPAGAAQMARLKALQEQYESSKPSALDDLIRVFGQAGQYKGLSGTGPAYTANQAQKRAQDLGMAQKINELMGGVETTQRGEMKDVATGALAGLGVDRAAQEAARKDKLQALSSGRTADVQASTQQRGQDIQLQIGKMQAAATAAAREMGADNKAITAAEAAFARDPEAAAIKKRLENPILANNPAKAAVDLQRLREIQASKYKQFGITLEGAPSAAGPSGTSLKYNPKTGKIE